MSNSSGQTRYVDQLSQELKSKFPQAGVEYVKNERYADEDTIYVNHGNVLDVARDLKNQFPYLLDVCGVDYPGRDKRFEVVYHFLNPDTNRRLRMKAKVDEGDNIPSLTPVYKSANWFEREAFDLLGLKFQGHPNLRRILCHEDFVGHPLRKDYPADRNQELKTPIQHTYEKDRERMLRDQGDYLDDKVWINIGPAHPATHGTLRFMAVLSGETIEKLDVEIGYLHRCFEKMCENHDYNQIIPYTDRLNYCSAPMNNNAWCRTIEKQLGVTIPARAQMMRVILDEFSRCIDHLVCITTNVVDLGGLTNFWLGFAARERVYELFEKLCGARLTVSLSRIGGMGFDFPAGWVEEAREVVKSIRQAHREIDLLYTKNRIFVKRMVGTGKISAESAINWGFTGPCLRATGVPLDMRVYAPYYGYDQLEFDVPVGASGDSYDRYQVRMAEILESCRILDQCLNNIPSGAITVDDPGIVLPRKQDVYGNIEGLMNQFMQVINGVKVPAGEIYQGYEAANGELGFYVVSDGSGMPYRVKCRPPCFAIFQAITEMCEGDMIADLVATLGTINIIAGELDR
ncbi:MAG: NADH dehydrogenase (quinone) subunit D [Pseudomonadota bacterium]